LNGNSWFVNSRESLSAGVAATKTPKGIIPAKRIPEQRTFRVAGGNESAADDVKKTGGRAVPFRGR
jgi:hypothetical protein